MPRFPFSDPLHYDRPSPRLALVLCLLLIAALTVPRSVLAWGKGHRLIRLWAVARLPEWQRGLIGAEGWERLCRDYTSLQDRHAGGNAPELDLYCVVPGVRLSLHDVNPPEPTAKATRWYLEQILEHLDKGETDEALKFLGVLCHWNEDPGCPSAHSSPINEYQLKLLIPPPKDKQRLNYLYGYGGIADVGEYQIPDVDYSPRLLGTTVDEAVLRIAQHQRLLRTYAAARIVPLVQDMMHGDGQKAALIRAEAAHANARHVADILYTVFCLAEDRFDNEQVQQLKHQRLTEWQSDFTGGRVGHPYYVTPFLVNQALDARRQLHPLKLLPRDEPVEFGWGMGTPYTLTYTLAPGTVYSRFRCRVGLHPTAGSDAAVRFAVKANGQTLHTTSPLVPGSEPAVIDVELPRTPVLNLELQTIAAGDGTTPSTQNLTVWAEPTLVKPED